MHVTSHLESAEVAWKEVHLLFSKFERGMIMMGTRAAAALAALLLT